MRKSRTSRAESLAIGGWLIAGAALLSLTGCPIPPAGNANQNSDGDANANAANENAHSNGNANSGPPPVSFSREVVPIFTANCVECHRRGGFADLQGITMRLTPHEAYLSIINQQSSQDSSRTRVIPGDPENSILYLKISRDDPPIGVRMPFERNPLDENQIETIRRWIAEGAGNN